MVEEAAFWDFFFFQLLIRSVWDAASRFEKDGKHVGGVVGKSLCCSQKNRLLFMTVCSVKAKRKTLFWLTSISVSLLMTEHPFSDWMVGRLKATYQRPQGQRENSNYSPFSLPRWITVWLQELYACEQSLSLSFSYLFQHCSSEWSTLFLMTGQWCENGLQ